MVTDWLKCIIAIENLGDLIDAKIEAGKKFKHFSDVLPNRVGKALADRIEDAIDDVLAKHLK